jgi:imidazolonepropionase-like amidohydrolase
LSQFLYWFYEALHRRKIATGVLIFVGSLLAACSDRNHDVVAWPTQSSDVVLIRNTAVIDVRNGQRITGRDVLIKGGKIAAIELADSIEAGNARVIEGSGTSLLPGLIDLHGHVSIPTGPIWALEAGDPEGALQRYLYAGITTIQDPGDGSADAVERRELSASKQLIGPRIYTAGKIITCPGGHPVAFASMFAPSWIRWYVRRTVATQVETELEVDAAIAARQEQGVDFIKIAVDRLPPGAPRMPSETINAVVNRAQQDGLRVAAHIGRTQDAIDTGEAGVSLWLHGVAQERISDQDVTRLAGYGIPMVATIEVADRYMRGMEGPIRPTVFERETIPAEVLDAFYPVPEDFNFDQFLEVQEAAPDPRATAADNILRLRNAGVTVLAGSDTQSGVFPGAGLHRELGQLVRAGLSPMEAIRAATLDAAIYLANEKPIEFGEVRVGLEADLLLVRGDPSQDVDALSDIVEVFVGGVPIERMALPGTD